MKKISTFIVLILVTNNVWAHDWALGGEYHINMYTWNNGDHTGTDGGMNIGILISKYFSKKSSAGIKSSFGSLTLGKDFNFSIGPFFLYDFKKYDLFSFGIITSFLYTRFHKCYKWDELFNALNANRITLNASVLIEFTPHEIIEFYISFMSVDYWFNWLTLPDYYNLKCREHNFTLSLPLNAPSTLGIKLKF